MQKTNIPWTDFSWNPSVGCENSCDYCYARKTHNMRHKAYLAGKKLPKQYAKPFEEIQLFPERLDAPLHKRKPCKIFVGSVADLFSPSVPFEFIDKVMDIINICRQHTFQILTKRPKRTLEYINRIEPFRWHSNIWLGVTAENQEQADKRIPILLQIPAAVRFVSVEPMLGLIQLPKPIMPLSYDEPGLPYIDWVIIGCESGPKRRPCKIEWVRDLVNQCESAGVAVFVKQLDINGKVEKDINKFPKQLQVRQYPKGGG